MDNIEREMIGEFDRISRIITLGAAKDLDAVGGFRLIDRDKFIHVFAANSLRMLRLIEDKCLYTDIRLGLISRLRRDLFDMARTNSPVMDRIYKRLDLEYNSIRRPLLDFTHAHVSLMHRLIKPEYSACLGSEPIGPNYTQTETVPCPWAAAWVSVHK